MTGGTTSAGFTPVPHRGLITIGIMLAVAIGRFNHQRIGMSDRHWRLHHQVIGATDITRHQQTTFTLTQLHRTSTQNMASRSQTHLQFAKGQWLVKVQRLEQL